MKYYLYILETLDNTLYCGIARDLLKRFDEHINKKGAKYTKSHPPKKIVYASVFPDKSSAQKEEYRIKHTLKRKEKLDLIEKKSIQTKEILSSLNFKNSR